MTKPGRLTVGIIGSGKVGPVLALALAGAGHHLYAITATGDSARERVAAMLPQLTISTADDIVRHSQLVILAVPGAQLEQLVAGLAELEAWQPGQLVLHTAPEHGTAVLQPAQARGAIGLALSPVMVFSGTSLDVARLQHSSCVVSAAAPVLPIAQALAVEMGMEPLVVDDAKRQQYGEIITYVSEFCANIVQQSDRRLAELGVGNPHQITTSLVESSIAEALRVRQHTDYEGELAV